jgi:hypothetical protein
MHVPELQMRPAAQSVSLVQPLLPLSSSSALVVKQPCAKQAAKPTTKGMKDFRPTNPSAMRPRFARELPSGQFAILS